MSDIPNSADEHTDTVPENANVIMEQSDPPQKKTEEKKPNPIASALLMAWNAVMIFCTAILSIYVFILKDDSAAPFFVLGVIGLCIPPMVSMIKESHRKRELLREYDEQIRMAETERIRQVKEREMERERERIKQEEIFAEKEIAEQSTIGNIDVAAFKIKNSME